MKALIISGGKGTRLQEVSKEIPKALFPIKGKSIVEYQIELLKKHGFKEYIFCIGYLGEKIIDYFGNGSHWGAIFKYVIEKTPLGTGGAIKNAYELVKDENDFFVIFGDIMIDMNITKMIKFHLKKKALITFAVHKSDHPEDSSNVKMDQSNIITSIGKPQLGHPMTGITRTSIQIVNKRIFDFIPQGKISLEDDVVPEIIKAGEPVYGYYTEELVRDMGTYKRYKELGGDLLK